MTDFLESWTKEDRGHERLVAQEELILDVTESIWDAMDRKNISKSQLAERLSTSRANVTQLLSGDRNMTLRTLSDIVFELDAKVTVIIDCTDKKVGQWHTAVTAKAVPTRKINRPIVHAPGSVFGPSGWTSVRTGKVA